MKFTDPRLFYNRIAHDYDSLIAERMAPDEVQKSVALVRRILPEPCKVLDVGCGTGRIALPLQDLGYEVTGLDVSERMIEIAEANGLQKCIVGDIEKLSSKSASFDAVVSFRTGFSYAQDEEAMTQIARNCASFLKHGGTMLWDTPNEGHFGPRVPLCYSLDGAKGLKRAEFDCFTHSGARITRVLKDCDFKVQEMFGDFDGCEFQDTSPRVLVWAQKSIPFD